MHLTALFPLKHHESVQSQPSQHEKCPTIPARVYALLTEAAEAHLAPAQMAIDAVIFTLSSIAAFLIRFEGIPTGQSARLMLLWVPIIVLARLVLNWRVGVYRTLWRFVCLCDAIALGGSVLVVSLAILSLRALHPLGNGIAQWLQLPFGVVILEFLLSLCGCTAARAGRRVSHESHLKRPVDPKQNRKRVLLYGAGRAGVLLIKELASVRDIEVVGFIDDNPHKLDTVLSGVKVLGAGPELATLVKDTRAEEVVISIVTASPAALTSILSRCKRVSIPAKIVPSMRELLSKEAHITHFRDIEMDDLLGRDAVVVGDFEPDVVEAYRGKRILVTGAGGSIGSELTRQLLLLEPAKISILDKDENSIYELEQELKFRDPNVPIEAVIADLKIPERVFAVFSAAKPEVVFHAAAHKHVPLMEMHPCEAILNNVMGTENLLHACNLSGVERLLFISTDKAVNPTNIMGATKRVCEDIVRRYAKGKTMKAACVRFGNVMGSRGSVVPLFMKQIREGGPVTVTHPDIVRYFMTIPEAVHLVLTAGSLADGGDVFVLDMGAPRKIMDLARQVIAICGLQPEKDIKIAFTGLRPGEKLNEELVGANETISSTAFTKISLVRAAPFDEQASRRDISRLIKAARLDDRHTLYDLLLHMGLGYNPAFVPLPRLTPSYTDFIAADGAKRSKAAAA